MGGTNIVDPNTLIVTVGGTTIPRVTSPGACGTANGFFYDGSGPSALLCPTTCATVRNDLAATIQMSYSCRGGCTSGSSQATPTPLDLLFVVDRSGGMATELKDALNNDTGVTAWAATQSTLRNFVRGPDAVGLGMALGYYPPPGPASNGKRCMTCMYCQDKWGSSDCNCEPCALPPALSLCWCGKTTDINLQRNQPVPWPFCPQPRNGVGPAGVDYGDCLNNITAQTATGMEDRSFEYLQGDSGSCDTADYVINPANAGVDYGVLPDGVPATTPTHWEKIFDSLGTILPESMTGSTPSAPVARPRPALESAITQASARQAATGRKQAVVLVTSGMPNTASAANCDSSSATVTTAAATGFAGGIQTYVIGVGAGAIAAELNPIAAAGSGNPSATAFVFTNTANPSGLFTALKTIRKQASSCGFAIPAIPAGGQLNYTATEVRLTSGSPATEQLLSSTATSASCASAPRWYYDNAAAPTSINLCTAPCTTVKSDLNSRVDVVYQCIVPPTYNAGVATFEFDSTGACGADEVPVWGDFSWRTTTPGTSKVSFVVATGDRSSTGTITNLSADVPLRFTRTGALSTQTACAATWTSGGANTCGFIVDTKLAGPQYAASPGDVYVDKSLAQASVPRTQNYLRIKATLTPSTDLLSRPTITGWDLQVSCKAAR
jgi:hypothetical protein